MTKLSTFIGAIVSLLGDQPRPNIYARVSFDKLAVIIEVVRTDTQRKVGHAFAYSDIDVHPALERYAQEKGAELLLRVDGFL